MWYALYIVCGGMVLAGGLPAPVLAKVTQQGENGFVVEVAADVTGKVPAQVWRALLRPAKWWDGAHSRSGNSANLLLVGHAGGCFCELIPASSEGRAGGGVEHARVIAAMPPRLLRLSGALGPLQSEALVGTLSISIEPSMGGTHVTWTYVVGGYMRMPVGEIAPAVDRVLFEQAERLARYAGPSSVGSGRRDRQGGGGKSTKVLR